MNETIIQPPKGKRIYKSHFRPKPFESTGVSNDTSANLFESMLISAAFQDLSKSQRLLYIYMKAQYYGKRKPGQDYINVAAYQGDDKFYFSRALAEYYGFNVGTLSKDIQALETHGFITKIADSDQHKSIYAYSSEWQRWRAHY